MEREREENEAFIFDQKDDVIWTEFIWLRINTIGGIL
jgi:hypothetical protein